MSGITLSFTTGILSPIILRSVWGGKRYSLGKLSMPYFDFYDWEDRKGMLLTAFFFLTLSYYLQWLAHNSTGLSDHPLA